MNCWLSGMSPEAVDAASEAPVEGTLDARHGAAATVEVPAAVDVAGFGVEALELDPPPLEPHPASGSATARTTTARRIERRWWARIARSITGPGCRDRAESLLKGFVRI